MDHSKYHAVNQTIANLMLCGKYCKQVLCCIQKAGLDTSELTVASSDVES